MQFSLESVKKKNHNKIRQVGKKKSRKTRVKVTINTLNIPTVPI